MAFPALELGGLAFNIGSSILQSEEARKRFRAMKQAARRIAIQQNLRENRAIQGINEARSAWENDPGRATLRSMWEERLKNPDAISEGDLSVLRNQGISEAGSEASGAITAAREQAQRSGLGSSKIGAGTELAVRARSFGRAAGLNNDLTLAANKANKASRDAVRGGYASYLSDENQTRSGYAQAVANLLGSRQYGESDLLAAM